MDVRTEPFTRLSLFLSLTHSLTYKHTHTHTHTHTQHTHKVSLWVLQFSRLRLKIVWQVVRKSYSHSARTVVILSRNFKSVLIESSISEGREIIQRLPRHAGWEPLVYVKVTQPGIWHVRPVFAIIVIRMVRSIIILLTLKT